MCFGSTHDCTVTCVNSYLNTTSLSRGIVESTGNFNGCHITCAAGVPIEDSVVFPTPTFEPVYLIPIMIIAGLIALALYYTRCKGDE